MPPPQIDHFTNFCDISCVTEINMCAVLLTRCLVQRCVEVYADASQLSCFTLPAQQSDQAQSDQGKSKERVGRWAVERVGGWVSDQQGESHKHSVTATANFKHSHDNQSKNLCAYTVCLDSNHMTGAQCKCAVAPRSHLDATCSSVEPVGVSMSAPKPCLLTLPGPCVQHAYTQTLFHHSTTY